MKRSEIVIALADVASQGRYAVDPNRVREMNVLYNQVAQLINELEAEELKQEQGVSDE